MIDKLILFIAVILFTKCAIAQQHMINLGDETGDLYINPAFYSNYKQKMVGGAFFAERFRVPNSPRTGLVFCGFPVRNATFGGAIKTDRNGLINENSVSFNYSYRINTGVLGMDFISFFLSASLSDFSLDEEDLNLRQMGDEVFEDRFRHFSYNFSAGGIYRKRFQQTINTFNELIVGASVKYILPLGTMNQWIVEESRHFYPVVSWKTSLSRRKSFLLRYNSVLNFNNSAASHTFKTGFGFDDSKFTIGAGYNRTFAFNQSYGRLLSYFSLNLTRGKRMPNYALSYTFLSGNPKSLEQVGSAHWVSVLYSFE
jgi:hypothetical protein